MPSGSCSFRAEDGTGCGQRAAIVDPESGGLVCSEHARTLPWYIHATRNPQTGLWRASATIYPYAPDGMPDVSFGPLPGEEAAEAAIHDIIDQLQHSEAAWQWQIEVFDQLAGRYGLWQPPGSEGTEAGASS